MAQQQDKSSPDAPDKSGASDEVVNMFTFVVGTGFSQTIGACGVMSNIINIICFAKMGFKETVNISLFSK
jgi:hypothetical protein